MKNIIFLLLIILFSVFKDTGTLVAQNKDFTHYTPLLSEAPVPIDFQTSYLEKVKEDRERLKVNKEDKENDKSEKFVVTSNFVISHLLQSGKILFNDPVSRYINHVADSLLKPFPDLRKELRFYAVKSPEVNAFATDKGMVFVNLGLISRLHNEAELAFVLAHEIVHFVKKHNINLFLEKEKIDNRSAENQGLNLKDKVFKKHFRSRGWTRISV